MQKDILPLRSFHYGLFYHQDQKASVSIGPLVCEGMKPLPTFANDCKSIKEMGQPYGYYILRNETSEEFQITNCTDDADTEAAFTLDNFDNTIVNFQAVKTTQCWRGNGYIEKYDKFEVNENGSFDLQKGKFSAPLPGVYSFSFSAYSREYTQFKVYINDKIIVRKYSGYTNFEFSFSWEMILRKNDTMRIHVENTSYYQTICSDTGSHNTILNGKLLHVTDE